MRLLRSSSHAACSNLYDAIPLCPFSRSVGRWFDEKIWKDSEDKSWSWGRNCPEDCDSNWVSIYLLDSRIRPKQHTNCRRNDQLGLRWSQLSHPHRMILVTPRARYEGRSRSACAEHETPSRTPADGSCRSRSKVGLGGSEAFPVNYMLVCYTDLYSKPPNRETLDEFR